MARTAITYSTLPANSYLADPAGTEVDPTNDHTIAKCKFERTLIRVTNTAETTQLVTVKAGANPPALASSLGDVTYTLDAATVDTFWDAEVDGEETEVVTPTVVWLGPFESGRFSQVDGSLSIDLASGHTGTITAFLIPKSQ